MSIDGCDYKESIPVEAPTYRRTRVEIDILGEWQSYTELDGQSDRLTVRQKLFYKDRVISLARTCARSYVHV